MLTISVPTVDGGLQEWTVEDSVFAKLISLQRDGLTGKELIHALLTDDWGPPPVGVKLQGTLADGTVVNEYLPYK